MTKQSELESREIVLQRLARNGLSQPFSDPLECVHSLVGIQSQFQQFAEVSIMNRCATPVAMNDLSDHYKNHRIINIWGQRNTLHMFVSDDWEGISDVYEPRTSGKNYAQLFPKEFVSLTRKVKAALAKKPIISREALQKSIDAQMDGLLTAEDYFTYAFVRASCLRGHFFGMPEKPGIRHYIGYQRIRDKEWRHDADRSTESLKSLMLRYFKHYGPATLKDFCHWSGLPQGASRQCLNSLDGLLDAHSHDGRDYFTHGAIAAGAPENSLFFLGKFDPLFVSYSHKDWIVPPKLQKQVWRNAGWVEAVIIDGSRLAGVWRHAITGKKMSVQVTQFSKLKVPAKRKVQERAERLASFWEKDLDVVTFK